MTQAERNTKLFEYIAVGTWINTLEIILKQGANVNTQNKHGLTPLHSTAILGRYALLNF